eukprot:jgi/Chrpa1/19486/Chrysochromulina_OHIO_Genome00007536-RA
MGRPFVALWALLAGAITGARSTDPPPTFAPGCSPADTVRACILSDRPEMMLAVLRSAHASASPRTCISWDLFTTDTERIERLMQDDPLEGVPHRHSVRVTTLLDAEMALEERGVTPVWMRSAFRKGVGGDPRRTLWSLRDPASDSDPKHSHPLNLLRFYLPLLPQMQHGRVLLFDDDVCVQDDLRELYHAGPVDSPGRSAHGPAVIASCQMQQWDSSRGGFRIRTGEYTYADTPFLGTIGAPAGYPICADEDDAEDDEEDTSFLGTIGVVALPCASGDCDKAVVTVQKRCAPGALEPKLTQLHSEISGLNTFRNETAWNFGITLVHLDRWRASGIDRRFERWFVANEHFAFFAPNTISFGLGVAYLALAGQVECWPEGTILDGLGFLTWQDFEASDMDTVDVEDYTVLHFAGSKKLPAAEQATCSAAHITAMLKQPMTMQRRLQLAGGYTPASGHPSTAEPPAFSAAAAITVRSRTVPTTEQAAAEHATQPSVGPTVSPDRFSPEPHGTRYRISGAVATATASTRSTPSVCIPATAAKSPSTAEPAAFSAAAAITVRSRTVPTTEQAAAEHATQPSVGPTVSSRGCSSEPANCTSTAKPAAAPNVRIRWRTRRCLH